MFYTSQLLYTLLYMCCMYFDEDVKLFTSVDKIMTILWQLKWLDKIYIYCFSFTDFRCTYIAFCTDTGYDKIMTDLSH